MVRDLLNRILRDFPLGGRAPHSVEDVLRRRGQQVGELMPSRKVRTIGLLSSSINHGEILTLPRLASSENEKQPLAVPIHEICSKLSRQMRNARLVLAGDFVQIFVTVDVLECNRQ